MKGDPVLVGIVGGSGAGKTWLSEQIAAHLKGRAAQVSMDDFYIDRSHLTPARRDLVNYDHPRSIDWPVFEKFLVGYRAGQACPKPRYDFKSHSRNLDTDPAVIKPVLLVEGLWVALRGRIRELLDFIIYIECPERTRLQRRIERDVVERARSATSVRERFERAVRPMHERFVAPQKRRANVIVGAPIRATDVERIVMEIRRVAEMTSPAETPSLSRIKEQSQWLRVA